MRNAMDTIKTERRSTRARNGANAMQEHTGSEMDANATQEHTGSNKRKKTRDAIKRNNKGRDDLETN
jgi:hypothetical protein